MFLLGSMGGVLWSSWASAGLVNSNQKKVRTTGVISKQHTRHKALGGRDCLGIHIRNLQVCDSMGRTVQGT